MKIKVEKRSGKVVVTLPENMVLRKIHKFYELKISKNGCWIWGYAKNDHGYGQICLPGGKIQYAHRFLYENLKGPIPDGHEIDHLCKTTSCVNPDHLEAVTPAENIRRGDHARLTEDQILEMVRLYRSGESTNAISKKFGMDDACVFRIVSGLSWKGVVKDSFCFLCEKSFRDEQDMAGPFCWSCYKNHRRLARRKDPLLKGAILHSAVVAIVPVLCPHEGSPHGKCRYSTPTWFNVIVLDRELEPTEITGPYTEKQAEKRAKSLRSKFRKDK